MKSRFGCWRVGSFRMAIRFGLAQNQGSRAKAGANAEKDTVYTHRRLHQLYALGQRTGLFTDQPGWVTLFHKHLQALPTASASGGRIMCRFQRDDKAQRQRHLPTIQINEQLKSAAVLVLSPLSPLTSRHPACQAELKVCSTSNNLLVGNRSVEFLRSFLCDVQFEEQREPLQAHARLSLWG